MINFNCWNNDDH